MMLGFRKTLSTQLRILHFENNCEDAQLVRETLARDGVEAEVKCVDTERAYVAALAHEDFDVILADYTLPSGDGLAALALAHTKRPGVPFIFVSGSPGEEIAIECLKSGATDYVLKHRVERLAQAVRRALNELHVRDNDQLAKNAWQASEDRYRQLFECNPVPMWVYDRETLRFLAVNNAAIKHYGYSREQFMAMTVEDIRPRERTPLLKDLTGTLENSNESGLWRHVKQDGTIILVDVTSHLIDFEGRPANLVLANDVRAQQDSEEALRKINLRLEIALDQVKTKRSELTTMSQQLWQASKLATMGELAASIAHELNNPLATVALRTEALVEQMWHDESKRRALEIILKETDRMATLVNNLLLFSRRGQRQVSTVDLREEVTTSLEFLSYHLRNHRIQVSLDFEEDLPTVQADRQQLRQLFLNLATNANDAMPGGGQLRIRVGRSEDQTTDAVIVEFTDNGEGIAETDLESVWEPFFTTKPEGKGTGLGLAICRRVVDEHGGTIAITSRRDEGTTVTVVLPATAKGMAATAAQGLIFAD